MAEAPKTAAPVAKPTVVEKVAETTKEVVEEVEEEVVEEVIKPVKAIYQVKNIAKKDLNLARGIIKIGETGEATLAEVQTLHLYIEVI